MAQTDLLKRYLEAGMAFTQLTQQRAEAIVKDLVKAGEVPTGEASRRVEELLERSRQNAEGLLEVVRGEVRSQVGKLGLVPKKELDAVKRELADLKAKQPKTVVGSSAKAPAAKKTTAKKPTVKKATAKTTTAVQKTAE
jgi:polyhydroxyalkanoate synthesis regulator phasin